MKRFTSIALMMALLCTALMLTGCMGSGDRPEFPEVFEVTYVHYDRNDGSEEGRMVIGRDEHGNHMAHGYFSDLLFIKKDGGYDSYDYDIDQDKWVSTGEESNVGGFNQAISDSGPQDYFQMTSKPGYNHADEVTKLDKTEKVADRECEHYQLVFHNKNESDGTEFDYVYECAVDVETRATLRTVIVSEKVNGEEVISNQTKFVCVEFKTSNVGNYAELID